MDFRALSELKVWEFQRARDLNLDPAETGFCCDIRDMLHKFSTSRNAALISSLLNQKVCATS